MAGCVCRCPSLFPCHKQLHHVLGREQQCATSKLCSHTISHHEFQEITPTSSAPFELCGPPRAKNWPWRGAGHTDLGSAGQAAPVAPELLGLPRTQGSEFFPLIHASPYLSPLEYTLLFIHANKHQAMARCFTKNPIKPILTELVPAKSFSGDRLKTVSHLSF